MSNLSNLLYVRRAVDSSNRGQQRGGLFLAVNRGKVSEGIDFPDRMARAVLLVGIPYPNVKDTRISLKKKYNDMKIALEPERAGQLLSGGNWYTLQAFRSINQAAGRCIRHRYDFGAIVYLDERFLQPHIQRSMSKWVQKVHHYHNSYDETMSNYGEFFEKWMESPPGPASSASPAEKVAISTENDADLSDGDDFVGQTDLDEKVLKQSKLSFKSAGSKKEKDTRSPFFKGVPSHALAAINRLKQKTQGYDSNTSPLRSSQSQSQSHSQSQSQSGASSSSSRSLAVKALDMFKYNVLDRLSAPSSASTTVDDDIANISIEELTLPVRSSSNPLHVAKKEGGDNAMDIEEPEVEQVKEGNNMEDEIETEEEEEEGIEEKQLAVASSRRSGRLQEKGASSHQPLMKNRSAAKPGVGRISPSLQHTCGATLCPLPNDLPGAWEPTPTLSSVRDVLPSFGVGIGPSRLVPDFFDGHEELRGSTMNVEWGSTPENIRALSGEEGPMMFDEYSMSVFRPLICIQCKELCAFHQKSFKGPSVRGWYLFPEGCVQVKEAEPNNLEQRMSRRSRKEREPKSVKEEVKVKVKKEDKGSKRRSRRRRASPDQDDSQIAELDVGRRKRKSSRSRRRENIRSNPLDVEESGEKGKSNKTKKKKRSKSSRRSRREAPLHMEVDAENSDCS